MSMPSSGKYTMRRSADRAYGKNNRLEIKSTNETKCRYLMKKLKKIFSSNRDIQTTNVIRVVNDKSHCLYCIGK